MVWCCGAWCSGWDGVGCSGVEFIVVRCGVVRCNGGVSCLVNGVPCGLRAYAMKRGVLTCHILSFHI